MAQSLAREFGPQGIHVAHVVVDGMIDTPGLKEKMGEDKEEKVGTPPPSHCPNLCVETRTSFADTKQSESTQTSSPRYVRTALCIRRFRQVHSH